MTSQAITQPMPAQAARQGLGALLGRITRNSWLAQAAREAERLQALTDEELARRGLRRDQILYRTFGCYLHY